MCKCKDCGENMYYIEEMRGEESYKCKVVDGILAIDSSSYELLNTDMFGCRLECIKCGYTENVNIEVDFR